MLRSEVNETRITLMYASPTIHVEKEEEAYSVRSLVVNQLNLGRALGLFVGFYFLMIWDFSTIQNSNVNKTTEVVVCFV